MDEIAKAIGREKSDYRIVSVGMNPAVSLFNGFYTVDGYSTDYPLEYKHEFREIIKDELAKDEGVRGYFDDWGNRCYIFSAELPVSTGLNNPTDEIENLAGDIMNYPLPNEVLLVCISYKPDKRSRFYKRFDGNATVKSFPLLNERELPAFINQE